MYIDPALITDETAVAEAILAGIADRIDGWEPSEGSPETEFAEAVAIVIATAVALVQDDERTSYEGFGTRILDAPRLSAQVASATATWTFHQAGSYVIPDGSEAVFDLPDGTPVAFATVGDVAVTGATEATGVPMVALEPGEEPNGVAGAARDFDALPFVSGVTLTQAASGGRELEDRDSYLDRVARYARRVKVVPITVDDYADTALDHASVARAVAVRLLDLTNPPPAGQDPSSAGHVSVFIADDAGNALSSTVKLAVGDLMLGEDRPLAVTVHVGDPQYTDLTPAVSIRLDVGADQAIVTAAVQAALQDAYNPATYALDDTAAGRWRAPSSTAERTITHYDIAHIARNVDGVAAVSAATINGTSSVQLDGWAPLPRLTGPPQVTVA